MTRVDFYILPQDTSQHRLLFAARLTEKALQQGLNVLLFASDESVAESLDELLWSFHPESFVPHSRLHAGSSSDAPTSTPVLISTGVDAPQLHDVLINLTPEVPPMFSRFQRLAEIVVQVPEVLSSTRNHYTFLRARGYQINTHQLRQ